MKRASYTITILNWEKYNKHHKRSFKATLIDNRFCSDAKLMQVPTSYRWTFLGLLLSCGDVSNQTVTLSKASLKLLTGSGIAPEKVLDALQELQLLTYEKNDSFMNRNEIKRIEKNRIEDKGNEKNITSEAKNPEIKIPSTHVSRAAIRGCIPEFENCLITKKYFDECSQDVQRSWIDAYPSVEFIQTECRKANSWILSNPQKAPKKFQRFFNNWLSKAYESYRKGIPSRRLTNSELNQESLKDLYKKVQEEKI